MKKLKENITKLGLSFMKEITIYVIGIVIIFALGVALYFLNRQVWMLLAPIICSLLFSYWYFSRYSSLLLKRQKDDGEEFVRLFSYFSIYLANGFNVYNCLEKITDFSSASLRGRLVKLLEDIQNDKSVTPFIEFAKTFGELSIKEVMVCVYQMVDSGGQGAYLEQFRHLFGKLSEQKYSAIKEKSQRKLSTLTALPLVGSGISMLALTLALVSIMGAYSNVL